MPTTEDEDADNGAGKRDDQSPDADGASCSGEDGAAPPSDPDPKQPVLSGSTWRWDGVLPRGSGAEDRGGRPFSNPRGRSPLLAAIGAFEAWAFVQAPANCLDTVKVVQTMPTGHLFIYSINWATSLIDYTILLPGSMQDGPLARGQIRLEGNRQLGEPFFRNFPADMMKRTSAALEQQYELYRMGEPNG